LTVHKAAETYDTYHRKYRDLTIPTCALEKLADGFRWTEGPVWFVEHDYLVFSDIPNSRLLRWVPGLGCGVFRADSGYANGNTRDRQGRLVSCEHGARRVTRTGWDGRLEVLADSYQGQRLNSPNDVVVASDGAVWFTDPPYGILSDYEGHKAEPEYGGSYVFRVDPASARVEAVATDFVKPNGLAFSPDERRLYIADSGVSHDPDGPHHIRVFSVHDGQRLGGGEVFAEISPGVPDGLRVDVEGNVWTSARDGVHTYAPDGTLLGKIKVPAMVSNLCFGGPKRNRLFITATDAVWSIFVGTSGAQRP
jgi:gluconolactonase